MNFRVAVFFAMIPLLAACSGPGYYLQAMSGQWKLAHARQDIQLLLDDPSTSPELVEHLKHATQIKAFAKSTLDLPSNGSYTSYVEVEGDALLWNVVATDEFSLQAKKWCFPVAGCVPYRGFFKHQKAKESAARLQNKGRDVIVSPAAAYSSLGWFKDPLLSTMFSGTDIRLAGFLFHELAHQRLYIKDDGAFNEGYASFVEEAGIKAWLESGQRQDDLKDWLKLQAVTENFSELIGQARDDLAKLYRSNEPDDYKREKKAEIFRSLSSSYEKLVTEKWHGKRYYAAWFQEPLNNARLALYNTYEGSHCAFQRLWDKAGSDPREFHRLSEQISRTEKVERQKWLKQSCLSIAPQANL
jgi:predicted aminopeptidase